MKIRQKFLEGSKVIVEYIYGTTNPYLGVVFIESGSNAQALYNLPDNKLIERVQQELGEEMMADLQATYR
jgi:hypothetical protein